MLPVEIVVWANNVALGAITIAIASSPSAAKIPNRAAQCWRELRLNIVHLPFGIQKLVVNSEIALLQIEPLSPNETWRQHSRSERPRPMFRHGRPWTMSKDGLGRRAA